MLTSPGSLSSTGAVPPWKCLNFRSPAPLQKKKKLSAPHPTLEKPLIYSFIPSKPLLKCFGRKSAGRGQHLTLTGMTLRWWDLQAQAGPLGEEL